MKDELDNPRRVKLESLSMAMKLREINCIAAAHTGSMMQTSTDTQVRSILSDAETFESWIKGDGESKKAKRKNLNG